MELQQQYGDDVQFFGVPEPNGSTEPSAEFVDSTGSGAFPHLHDPAGEIWSMFGVTGRQTYILIDADGTPTTVQFGDLVTSVEALAP